MLILTRKVEQGIVFRIPNGRESADDNLQSNEQGTLVSLKVLSVKRDRVKIGIVAPQEITVLRGELVNREVNEIEASRAGEKQN